ncbi:hypothetical protein NDU88_003401 [Pleurodeles waltl]|uniref:Reverse transcriptase domain-containing protein n=1 Tax=Pleurodeles waltl TaxID=8319 RepID=A0AAV7TPN5_PLEWA|nr:hypothetical protein NDU88_003401 [Pleurodeles waltl]
MARNTMILDILKFCLENNYFLYDGHFYLQLQWTAMGEKFAPPYACILMEAVENSWLWTDRSEHFTQHIIFWGRYIDDFLLIWQEISEEEYEEHRKEVGNLTQRIEEANWGEITTKNYAILNSVIDRYE